MDTSNQTTEIYLNQSLGSSEEEAADYYDISFRAKWVTSQPNTIISLTLASAAIVSNVISLLALSQVHSRLSAYIRLIGSLSVADILIGEFYK